MKDIRREIPPGANARLVAMPRGAIQSLNALLRPHGLRLRSRGYWPQTGESLYVWVEALTTEGGKP